MPVYTVHAPAGAAVSSSLTADKVVFVRDGFHVWAMLLGPLWLLGHRLWWALLGYLALSLAGEVALSWLGAGSAARLVVMLLVAILMGAEGATLWRWTLSRGRWRQLDVVVADSPDSAERRFFDRWAEGRRPSSPSADRGAPPPARPGPSIPGAAPDGIIGLFPQPGVLR